jgi:hypothetical protein
MFAVEIYAAVRQFVLVEGKSRRKVRKRSAPKGAGSYSATLSKPSEPTVEINELLFIAQTAAWVRL